MPVYLGITIGPIYRTMQQARKLRELWSASFTFSRLMKHLSDEFSKIGILLSPNGQVKQPLHGAGVFPDRCYIQLNQAVEPELLINCKTKALNSFSKETGINTGLEYYQIYIIQRNLNENPIGELNRVLDAVELQQNYFPKNILDFDKKYWNSSNPSISKNFFQNLYKVAYEEEDILPVLVINNNESVRRFPSIPEISTDELAKKDHSKYWSTLGYQGIETKKGKLYFEKLRVIGTEKEDDDKIIEAIKAAFPDEFKTRHKYFSIIQADGDNVGKLIKAIEEQKGDIHELSSALNNFAEDAAKALVEFGAFPVYIGGDDLLFFSSLSTNEVNDSYTYPTAAYGNILGNNLFFLLSRLDRLFKSALQPATSKFNVVLPVSLSFGVMVGYYKHPMAEVQSETYNLLFHNAKKHSAKNYIAMKVQKHSGQSFGVSFKMHGQLYESFLRLSALSHSKDESFLNSFMYKLDDQKQVINSIAEALLPKELKLAEERFDYFLKENFNEAIHIKYHNSGAANEKKDDPFFTAIRDLIIHTYLEYGTLSLNNKMERIYGALRFIHLINAKDIDE